MAPKAASAKRPKKMPKLTKTQKVDRLPGQFESFRFPRSILIPFASFIRGPVRPLGTNAPFSNHAANNLIDDFVQLLGFFRFWVLQPVITHLRRNVPQRN